eukprot:4040962-Prorocentrum_lima.AAC.1
MRKSPGDGGVELDSEIGLQGARSCNNWIADSSWVAACWTMGSAWDVALADIPNCWRRSFALRERSLGADSNRSRRS